MRIYWLWLATRPGMSDRERMAALTHFGSPEDCYYADDYSDLELSKDAVASLQNKELKEAEDIIAAEGGRIELSGDGKGNIYVEIIPNEGYTFSSWQTADGIFDKTGSISWVVCYDCKSFCNTFTTDSV